MRHVAHRFDVGSPASPGLCSRSRSAGPPVLDHGRLMATGAHPVGRRVSGPELTSAGDGHASPQSALRQGGVGVEVGSGIELQRAARRRWLIHRMLLVGDVLGLVLAFVCTQLLLAFSEGRAADLVGPDSLFFVLSLPVWVGMITVYSLYERDDALAHASTVDDLPGTFHLLTVGSVIVFGG